MKIKKSQAIAENRDKVRSLNYKMKGIPEKYQSVVVAELDGIHGEVVTQDTERVYYIVSGKGEFKIGENIVDVDTGDVLTIPANTRYDYWPTTEETLKVVLFMELWDN